MDSANENSPGKCRAEQLEIERLKAGDESAWCRVCEKSVRLEMQRFRHSHLVHKWRISEKDLLAKLFEDMVVRGKLALYRGEGDLYGWLGKYVVGYIYHANPAHVLEIPVEHVCEEAVNDAEGAFARRDWRRFADWCFGALWRKGPLRAYVHYLRQAEGLSSREIRDLLGLSSEANVDQLASRFRRELRERMVRDA